MWKERMRQMVSRVDNAAIEMDFRMIILFIVGIFILVIGASIYFTLSTPAGQSGLTGIGMGVANAISSPFLAFFNGIAKVITNFFSGIGSAVGKVFGL